MHRKTFDVLINNLLYSNIYYKYRDNNNRVDSSINEIVYSTISTKLNIKFCFKFKFIFFKPIIFNGNYNCIDK